MLRTLDLLLTLVHFAIIGFNLFGWIWQSTRKLHFIGIVLTACSWFILGVWFGIGYCPITDWQWQIKEKLGEYQLPGSFIKYYVDKISGKPVSASLIDILTAICFSLAALLSVYVNLIGKRK
ncbi:MAG: hypothetical protein JWP78_1156 [Mucilaginibacter sp.]|nr:hypothetical protein [Mucilaginibacter sp.]